MATTPGSSAASAPLPPAPEAPPAPVARVEVGRDTYFGETLSDPCRWMEHGTDPDWPPFLAGQNARTRAILDALPTTRAGLLKRIQQLTGAVDTPERFLDAQARFHRLGTAYPAVLLTTGVTVATAGPPGDVAAAVGWCVSVM